VNGAGRVGVYGEGRVGVIGNEESAPSFRTPHKSQQSTSADLGCHGIGEGIVAGEQRGNAWERRENAWDRGRVRTLERLQSCGASEERERGGTESGERRRGNALEPAAEGGPGRGGSSTGRGGATPYSTSP
jgi:hypothetical protein